MVNFDSSVPASNRSLRSSTDEGTGAAEERDDRTSFARFLTVDQDKYAEVPCSD